MRDHSGQIAFPGGKIEPGDASPCAAALREAEEEIGLTRDNVMPIGYLEPYVIGTGYLVVPTVATAKPQFRLTLDPGEVAEAFEVPLPFLMDPQNHLRHRRESRGREEAVLRHAVRGPLHLGRHRGHPAQPPPEALRLMVRGLVDAVRAVPAALSWPTRFCSCCAGAIPSCSWPGPKARLPCWWSRGSSSRSPAPSWRGFLAHRHKGAYVPAHIENGVLVPGRME